MGKFRDSIDQNLRECEAIEKDIENIIEVFNEIKTVGGETKLILSSNNGKTCNIENSIDETEAFIRVLLTKYNGLLKSLKNETILYIEGMMRET